MIELSYWSFILLGIIFVLIGVGIAWRHERNRYESLIDIYQAEIEALRNSLRDEILENVKTKSETSNK